MADQRHVEARTVPPAPRICDLRLGGRRIAEDVLVRDRPALLARLEQRRVRAQEKPFAHRVVFPVLADGDEDLELVSVQAIHVAEVCARYLENAFRDCAQHRVDIQRRAELEGGVDEQAEILVPPFESLDQHRLLERPRQQPPDVADEIEVHGVVAHLRVEDVDQADGTAVHHQRQRHHAVEAPAAIRLLLGLVEVRALEIADDQGLVGGQGGHRRRVRGQLSLRADLVGVPAVAVDAGETAEHAAVDLPDVAVLGGQDGAQPLGHGPGELLERARLVEAVAELHELAERRVAATQPGEQFGVAQGVADGPSCLGQEPAHILVVTLAHVEQVDEADDLVVAHERHRRRAVEVVLGEVLALEVGEPVVVQRADHEDLPVLDRLLGGRVSVERQDVAADAGVDAVVVHAGEAAQVALLQPPDVAVGAVRGVSQPRRGALGDVHGRLRRGEVGAEFDQLLAQPGHLPRLVEERRAVEDAGDQLAHAGKELEVRAPVALRVVVEVHQPDQLAAGHEGHGERARVPPVAHEVRLSRAQAIVAQVGDRQRRVVEQRSLQGGIPGRVQDGVPHAGIGPPARAADGHADHAAARAPHVDSVRARGRQQPLREAQDEALEVVGLRHFSREVDQLSHGLVAVPKLVDGLPDRDRLGAHPRKALDHLDVPREVAFPSVAELDGPDEFAAQHQRSPDEGAAAAPLHGQPGAAIQAFVRGLQAGQGSGRRVALRGDPVGGGPRRPQATGFQLAALERDGEPQPVAVGEVDVAARRRREAAEHARRLGRHRVRVVGQERHEVQPRLQRRAQVLRLPAQVREVAGLGGAFTLHPAAGARGRRRRGSGGGRRGCGGRRCDPRRSSAAPCSGSRPASSQRLPREARRPLAPLSRWSRVPLIGVCWPCAYRQRS